MTCSLARKGRRAAVYDEPLLAKAVAAPGGPAAAQVKSTAGCSVNDRQSPWVTLLTGTWRARPGLADLPYSPAVYPRGQAVPGDVGTLAEWVCNVADQVVVADRLRFSHIDLPA